MCYQCNMSIDNVTIKNIYADIGAWIAATNES